MIAALTAALLLALLVSLALGLAGHKPAGWRLWTATEAALLVIDLVAGNGLPDTLLDAGGTLLGVFVLWDLRSRPSAPAPAEVEHRTAAPAGRERERGWSCICGAPWITEALDGAGVCLAAGR